ncbi:hypothetical protein FVF58_09570 [Paraburkholderia panacisoli]|uniref:Uncharacterized protein n=1 Tax=Paraburkholderia panacisoli TaxID=2603818 RepID=A0A5B0HCK3_9BURK|nr:hypothetical protein [Paraburkholderia panacisoli]KAA1013029.1 hypothetical protein FVF58_09570 [Paraburkholderia panacisoli]
MNLKTCTKCGVTKAFDHFHAHNRSKDGKRSTCKTCRQSEDPGAAARARRYYANNREKVLAYQKAYSKDHPEVAARSQKVWLGKNGFLYQVQWKRNNPGRVNALTAKRRECVRRATPTWANLVEIEKFYIEARALTESTGVPHHVDHVVPMTSKLVCGLHCQFNLQVLPGKENLQKHNRHWPDMP